MPSEIQPEFVPLRPPPRGRLGTAVVASLLWLFALLILAVVVRRTNAIAQGLLVAFAALVVWTAVLLLLRAARNRERERAEHAG